MASEFLLGLGLSPCFLAAGLSKSPWRISIVVMAATVSTPPEDQVAPGHAHLPVSLEPAIKTLLGQQAEINAKLAFLLPQKYSINVKSELDNLRHKLRVLRTFADDNQLLSRIPILSEIEEARQLQYQIECIEAACLEHGHDFLDGRILNTLSSIHQADAPTGFGEWLKKNMLSSDPAIRAWGQSDDNIKLRQNSPGQNHFHHRHFPKCSSEHCVHYIYGFLSPDEFDQHHKTHIFQAKRDSGLSVGGPASGTSLPDPSRNSMQATGPNLSSPTHALPPTSQRGGKIQLPPLSISNSISKPSQKRGSRDLIGPFPSLTDFSALTRVHTSPVDSDSDALLPPLKRGRFGPSRLESIGELRLPRENTTCFRCRILKVEVCCCISL